MIYTNNICNLSFGIIQELVSLYIARTNLVVEYFCAHQMIFDINNYGFRRMNQWEKKKNVVDL